MIEPDQPDIHKRRSGDTAFVCGLIVVWGYAHWVLVSSILWGGTVCESGPRYQRTGCRVETDLWLLWPWLVPWFLVGPVFLLGTLIFLWLQRDDRV